MVLYLEPRACSCTSFEDEDGCGCGVCAERATILAGCPHRLERVVTAEARNDRFYDGLCNACFEQAREVRDCGLRVAEHAGEAGER
jgi:hypothetical protein